MRIILTICLAMISVAGTYASNGIVDNQNNKITRYSLMDAIKHGYLNSVVSVGDLKKSGDFGVGGFTSFAGEMVLLDNQVYKIPFDGVPRLATDDETLTYAQVTHFNPYYAYEQKFNISKLDLLDKISKLSGDKNFIYAVKISGEFSYIQYRSIVEQQYPYPKEICAKYIDHIFESHDTKGIIMGFINPSFVKGGIDYPGSHLHFISNTFDAGGHVYDFTVKNAKVELARYKDYALHLPSDDEFKSLDMDQEITCPNQN